MERRHMSRDVLDAFQFLSNEVRELSLHKQVPLLFEEPTPVQFMRDWVAQNRPVVIRGAADHWPAVDEWSFKYLRDLLGTKLVTVAVTPNGYADAIHKDRFVMPEERNMPFAEFVDVLEHPGEHPGVFYVQKQNSNLHGEFSKLFVDVPTDIKWASEALGKKPDAANLWIGDSRSVTSMHKDHYENLYCVIQGHKDFILHPPCDLPWIPYRTLPPATFKETSSGQFDLVEADGDPVPWISIDPLKPDLDAHPGYSNATRIECRVSAGDMLYLPSMWFHHVRQSDKCIAVNYWYDMTFDVKYAYFGFLERLVSCVHK